MGFTWCSTWNKGRCSACSTQSIAEQTSAWHCAPEAMDLPSLRGDRLRHDLRGAAPSRRPLHGDHLPERRSRHPMSHVEHPAKNSNMEYQGHLRGIRRWALSQLILAKSERVQCPSTYATQVTGRVFHVEHAERPLAWQCAPEFMDLLGLHWVNYDMNSGAHCQASVL